MKVTPYVINKGTSSEYWGLKSVEDDPRDSQVLHTPKWKSKKSAIKYAEKNGMEVVESSSKASRKFVVSATNISCSDLTDEQAGTLYELSTFAEDVIRDVEKDYGKKLSSDGWGAVMDYAEEITKHPEMYRMTGTGIDSAKLHLESVIYDIYEDDTGIRGIYESTDIKCSSRRKYTQAKATVPEESADDFKRFLDSIGIDYTTEDVPNGVEFMYGIYVGSKESNRIDKYLDKITSNIRGGTMKNRKFVISAGMSPEKFYTRDFPEMKPGQVKVAPQRGNYTVFIGLSDGTIAYQWCESKFAAQSEAKYARDVVKKYGSDAPYWTAEGYKIWNPKADASTSTKRRFTVTASAKTDLVKKLTSLYNDYNAIEDDRALRKTGMTLAEYNALPSVFEKLQKDGHANTIMTGLANYFKKFGFDVSLDGTDYEISASTSTKRKFSVKASATAKRKAAIKASSIVLEREDADALKKFLRSQRIKFEPSGYGTRVYFSIDASPEEVKSINNFLDDYFAGVQNYPDTVDDYFDSLPDVNSAKSIKCAVDPDATRFTADAMYERNRGLADSEYSDDWSKIEEFAHDALMRGFWVSIKDNESGDELVISPDEYNEAWENGAADFDINDEIVEFKQRIVNGASDVKCSTSINCADTSGNIDIYWNGQFVYSGSNKEFAEQLEYIFERDEDAMKAAIDYCNSFGDPLIDESATNAKDVAETLTEVVYADWSDAESDEELYVDIPTESGRLEILPSSQGIDASTKIESTGRDTSVNADLTVDLSALELGEPYYEHRDDDPENPDKWVLVIGKNPAEQKNYKLWYYVEDPDTDITTLDLSTPDHIDLDEMSTMDDYDEIQLAEDIKCSSEDDLVIL